jgi:hypothetical protein
MPRDNVRFVPHEYARLMKKPQGFFRIKQSEGGLDERGLDYFLQLGIAL